MEKKSEFSKYLDDWSEEYGTGANWWAMQGCRYSISSYSMSYGCYGRLKRKELGQWFEITTDENDDYE
jgi:hypothetical protein